MDEIKLDREHYNHWIEQELKKGTPEVEIIRQLRVLDGKRPRTPETYERYVNIVKDYMKKRPKT